MIRLRPILLLLACSLLTACSGLGLIYNRLDWLASHELNGYVDLTPPQQAQFDADFDELWRWHRHTQLPAYAADLRALAEQAQSPLSTEAIERWGQTLRSHSQTLIRRAVPTSAKLLASLDDAQTAALIGKLRKDIDRSTRKAADRDDAKHREHRASDARDRLKKWTGAVTDEQLSLITRWAASLHKPNLQDANEASQVLNDFQTLLDRRNTPGFETRLAQFLQPPETTPDDDPDQAGRVNLLADLSRGLTPTQRAYLRQRLRELAGMLDGLAVQS